MPVVRAIPPIDVTTATHFWKFVDVRGEDECWLWRGGTKGAYGVFTLSGHKIAAHRVAYAIRNSGVVERVLICHTCDVPLCVNPRHLFSGSYRDNMVDMHAKGRGNKSQFTRAQVEEMRALRQRGETYRLIGAYYGVSNVAIKSLLGGKYKLKDE